jgi:hypothetical protein
MQCNTVLRGCLYDILNVHALVGDETNNTQDRFCEEPEHIFNEFIKYHMKIC